MFSFNWCPLQGDNEPPAFAQRRVKLDGPSGLPPTSAPIGRERRGSMEREHHISTSAWGCGFRKFQETKSLGELSETIYRAALQCTICSPVSCTFADDHNTETSCVPQRLQSIRRGNQEGRFDFIWVLGGAVSLWLDLKFVYAAIFDTIDIFMRPLWPPLSFL